jgi:cytochrome c oxidase cbb3-type subunit 3
LRTTSKIAFGAAATIAVIVLRLFAQEPGQNPGGQPGAAGAFPSRPKGNPEAIARGRAAYNTNCAYCHGEDARGGENGGTNLIRSDYIMKDKNGELLRQFLLNAESNQHSGVREGVLKFRLSPEQAADLSAFIADIATYIQDFRLSSRDPGRMRPPTILVGDAKAGEAYFNAKCASCHSVTGDLKGIATKIPDARTLQQTWLMPVVYGGRGATARPNAKPVTVTVTLPGGQKVEGRLGRIDDFIVTLTMEDGTSRSFRRDGDQPRVEVNDPMKPHKDLLPVYTDRDIHNVTAYLSTIK